MRGRTLQDMAKLWLLALVATTAGVWTASADESAITLELIMSDTDWLGNAPERPYWADDSRSFYYFQKVAGEERRELIQMDLKGNVLRVVADEDRGSADLPGGAVSPSRKWKAYSRHGDLYLKNLRSGEIRQLTRTREAETDPRFMAGEDRISFRRDGAIFVRDLTDGMEYQPADLRTEDDPDEKDEEFDFLQEQEEGLFVHLRQRKQRREDARERSKAEQAADATRMPLPWYLGKDSEVRQAILSPRGNWMVLRVVDAKRSSGPRGTMPNYVTETGYVTTRSTRPRVGTAKPTAERLLLLDLAAHETHAIDLSVLPHVDFDPLEELKKRTERQREEENEKDEESVKEEESAQGAGEKDSGEEKEKKPKLRPLTIFGMTWSEDGERVALQFSSSDHKDRWIAVIDLDEKKLVPLEHMTDEAWINRRFTQIGWLRDNRTLFYLSEETGYSHLYLRPVDRGPKRQLTSGDYEVSSVFQDRDGKYLYYRANAVHPGIHELYRVDVRSGEIEQITSLGGSNRAIVSPNEKSVLVVHSSTTRPNEIYIQRNRPGAGAERMTHTVSEKFASLRWREPEIVAIASRTGR
ncbi:DPP IV N-terminal domain-containing protein, partial [Candidatus Sumerlaeota bacterium]|nr:DPP IV N-terminal domain-containing protein [Candidatus Sumerlaeota bacterium]